MSSIKDKAKSLLDKRNLAAKSTVLFICAVIALSLALFFVALFAPFQYYSNKEVLHTVGTNDKEEGAHVLVYQNTRVHQSVFKLFGAAGALGAAGTLRSKTTGIPTDLDKYQTAKAQLDGLRAQYRDIYQATVDQAAKKGVSANSAAFQDMFADNLSRMNLIALDMLETALQADNVGAYEALFAGCVLGMLNALVNIFIMLASVIALVFAAVALATKKKFGEGLIFLRIFTVLSITGMMMCIFNPMFPPAASPLALACLSVIVYFCMGLARSLLCETTGLAVKIKNGAIAATISASVLALAAMPSYTVYVNGLGGRYLYYPGTVGTAYYSWVTAMLTTGLKIPGGALAAANVLGIVACLVSVAVTVLALDRQYRNAADNNGFFAFLSVVAALMSIALIASSAAITSSLQDNGKSVKYIAGACWYSHAGMMAASALFYAVFRIPRSSERQPAGGAQSEAQAEDIATETQATGEDNAPQNNTQD